MIRAKIVGIEGGERSIRQAAAAVFDLVEEIMAEEAASAVLRIQTEGFGAETGPPGSPPLRVRSGDALASMGSDTNRTEPLKVVSEFGSLFADPAAYEGEFFARDYLRVHETGALVMPRYAEKLAFPPGDAGPPIRDESGVQQYTAREFADVKESFGYEYLIYTDSAILGRQIGSRETDLLFIRADAAVISARRPIGREAEPTVAKMTARVRAVLGT